ncbi:DsbA family protein [Kribbella kalugense]|uniref:Protein-disulfide isomerase n=1 Tax=Kribbella kalugense TaxID=2512221 RepID=A0A4R8A2N1_9ACTN|nr:thioredoxin domain-containing protein [Kribbella kalugense]TDW24476.1 protein-disulfide isomerase [Kribbella kalugense]
MTKNLKLSLLAVLIFLGVFGAMVAINATTAGRDATDTAATTSVSASTSTPVTRANSHRLSTAADGKVTFVEFLDFECEACRAAFPVIEQLRKEYAGRVTFVVRYFPIQSHFNAERAARAVEAASKQGGFEAMYQKMYATQEDWGEGKTPADDTFRGFARELGLDLAAYDKAYVDPATLQRVDEDVADGTALGVEGTPTFFLNGQKLTPESADDLRKALDDALDG